MAQYNDGTVAVTNSSATVVGTGVDWSSINVGDLFVANGHATAYEITAIDTSNDELTLSVNYGGPTVAALTYAIVQDFTPNFNIPKINRGDVETATIFSRAMTEIDKWLGVQTSQSALTALTSSSTTATATLADHGLWTGALVTITGATPSGYNGTFEITVVDKDTFTYTLPSSQAVVTVLPNMSFRSAVSLGRVHTQAGHNFKVGSVLTYGSSGFELAKSTGSEEFSYIVGIVSSVTGSSFTLASQGLVVGIPDIGTPSAGDVYYLKNAADPENLTATAPAGSERKVPIFIAHGYINSGGTDYTYGQIVNFPIGQTTAMTGATDVLAGGSGAAPAPSAGDEGKFLRGDATWQDALPAVNSLQAKHFEISLPASFDAAAWALLAADPNSSTGSVIAALLDLNTRIDAGLSVENFDSGLQSIPFVASTPVPHGLSGRPQTVEIVFESTNTSSGWTVGQQIKMDSLCASADVGVSMPMFSWYADATNVYVNFALGSSGTYIAHAPQRYPLSPVSLGVNYSQVSTAAWWNYVSMRVYATYVA